MCSWCYGFSNELDTIIKNNPKFELKLIMGRLRPNSTEKGIDMADFLKSDWVEINKKANQPFSFDILKDTVCLRYRTRFSGNYSCSNNEA